MLWQELLKRPSCAIGQCGRPGARRSNSTPAPRQGLGDALLLLCAAPLATVAELARFGLIPTSMHDRVEKLVKWGMVDLVSHCLGSLGRHAQRRNFLQKMELILLQRQRTLPRRVPVSRQWFGCWPGTLTQWPCSTLSTLRPTASALRYPRPSFAPSPYPINRCHLAGILDVLLWGHWSDIAGVVVVAQLLLLLAVFQALLSMLLSCWSQPVQLQRDPAER